MTAVSSALAEAGEAFAPTAWPRIAWLWQTVPILELTALLTSSAAVAALVVNPLDRRDSRRPTLAVAATSFDVHVKRYGVAGAFGGAMMLMCVSSSPTLDVRARLAMRFPDTRNTPLRPYQEIRLERHLGAIGPSMGLTASEIGQAFISSMERLPVASSEDRSFRSSDPYKLVGTRIETVLDLAYRDFTDRLAAADAHVIQGKGLFELGADRGNAAVHGRPFRAEDVMRGDPRDVQWASQ